MSISKLQTNLEARRNLLKLGTCGAMTNATFLSTLMHLKMTNTLMSAPVIAPPSDYKAMVCLFFNGAIDSFNVLTPHGTTQGDAQFADYVATRGGAALQRDPASSVFNDTSGGSGATYGYLKPIVSKVSGQADRTFGLHPRFVNLKNMYDAGHATFVANCGALYEPILNKTEYSRTTAPVRKKPLGLFSHSDQQRHWQTAVPQSKNQANGWAAKMLDLFVDPMLSASNNIYTAVSTAGQSILLTGDQITPFAIGGITTNPPTNGGATQLGGFSQTATTSVDKIYTAMQNDYASQLYADVLEKTIRDNRKDARDGAALFQTTFLNTSIGNGFPTSSAGPGLASVAKDIKMAKTANANPTGSPLEQKRQIFLVQVGGWDHHANLLGNQNSMIKGIDDALQAFYQFLITEQLLSKVTLFSISDFSRTLSFNGSGTDHAWGANTIVMGGAVNATAGNNRVWGTYPDIRLDSAGSGIDLGRGVLIPQTSSDVYHAEICRWFGVANSDSELKLVLPNIRNFYSAGAASPIPFLNAP